MVLWMDGYNNASAQVHNGKAQARWAQGMTMAQRKVVAADISGKTVWPIDVLSVCLGQNKR